MKEENEAKKVVAEVILNNHTKQLNHVFDYGIPENLTKQIKVGSRVFVQFGNRKELEEGFVVTIKEKSNYQIKNIISIEEKSYLIQKNIELANWMAKRYFCNFADCMNLMVAPGTTTKVVNNRMKEKNVNFLTLNQSPEEIEIAIQTKQIKSEKQIKVLKFLIKNGQALISEIEISAETTRGVVQTLIKNGYLKMEEQQIERNPFIHKKIEKNTNLQLTQEQQNAYNKVQENMEDHLFGQFLLFGVTGSRKNRSLFTINTKILTRRKNKHYTSTRNFINTTNGRQVYCQIWGRKNSSIA